MGELTIGQKAKLYDEVVNKLKGFMAQGVDPLITRADVQDFFPELKENEDEKIREALLEHIKGIKSWEYFLGISKEQMIAWLEKQGQTFTKKDVDDAYLKGVCDTKHELDKQGEQKEYTFKSLPRLLDMIEPTSKAKAYCQKLIDALVKEGYTTDAKIVGECLKAMNGENVPMAIMDEKQGEQKQELLTKEKALKNSPFVEQKPADNLEPKFHEGDIMRTLEEAKEGITDGLPVVVSIDEEYYHCNNETISIKDQDKYEYPPMNRKQKYAELAKGEDYGIDGICAAVDILKKTFGKVDGYETDDGKLEHECAISAVEQLSKQKPAWSEKDEEMFNYTINLLNYNLGIRKWIKSLKFKLLSPLMREFDKEEGSIIDHLIAICDDAMCYDTFAGCSKKDIEKYKSFLTNLKFGINPQPQNTWKPSEEQMKVLDVAIMNSHLTTAEYEGLVKLREQLKKL